MEVIHLFGYRFYKFYSNYDLNRAISIYAHCFGTLDDFENELDKAGIDWDYELP